MKYLVTGGTGLLGNNLLRLLTEAGHTATAITRGPVAPEVAAGIDADWVVGELNDDAFLRRSIDGCDGVIHSAGVIHLGWKRLQESLRINRDATSLIAAAAADQGVRLVHVGTVNTMAIGSASGPSDETTDRDANGGQIDCSYVVSKRAGNDAVHKAVRQSGLDAVLVHPGFMLGPYDWKPSSGRMYVEVTKAWRPLAPAGGCSVCDVRDVAAGCIAALTADVESGRDFILAGHQMTYLDLWRAMAQAAGQRQPLGRLGPVPRWLAGIGGDLAAKVTGRESDINSAAIAMSSQYHWHDSGRAIDELGYTIRPFDETLRDAAEWLQRFAK